MSLQPSKFSTNLERWRYYLQDYESPDIFIDWTFYVTISAALQRRISSMGLPASHTTAPNNIYPNMYVVFIADPGIGKSQAANQSKYIFSSFDQPGADGHIKQIIKRGPDSVTLEALTRYMSLNYTQTTIPEAIAGTKGKIYAHCSLAMFCGDELGTLMRENTNDLVTFLNQGWDCGDFHRETKTRGVDTIKNMCITLLGCAVPDWVRQVTKTGIMNNGFSARTIFVWGPAKRHKKFSYEITEDQKNELLHFRGHVEALSKLYGHARRTPEAQEWCRDWYENKMRVVNKHRSLKDYYARKKVHLEKVAMAMHFADSLTMELTVPDYERALLLLERTELEMDRAIALAGVNPIANIATGILSYLEHKPFKRERNRQIIVDFFSEGDIEQINEALLFLTTSGQLEALPQGAETYYQLPAMKGTEDEQTTV